MLCAGGVAATSMHLLLTAEDSGILLAALGGERLGAQRSLVGKVLCATPALL